MLCCLREDLEISQCRVVQNLVLSQITAGLDTCNLLNGIQYVLRIGLSGLGHKSTASCMTRSRI
jgi:hypothetical protein